MSPLLPLHTALHTKMQNLVRSYHLILLKIQFFPLRSRSSGCPPSLFISFSLSPSLSFSHHLNPVRFINIKKDGESSGLPPTPSIRLPPSSLPSPSLHRLTLQRLCIIIVHKQLPTVSSVCLAAVNLSFLRLMFIKHQLWDRHAQIQHNHTHTRPRHLSVHAVPNLLTQSLMAHSELCTSTTGCVKF